LYVLHIDSLRTSFKKGNLEIEKEMKFKENGLELLTCKN
jgi:hypothetical protein